MMDEFLFIVCHFLFFYGKNKKVMMDEFLFVYISSFIFL